MVRRQARDQPRDAVADLQREVGGGGAHQLTHVLDGDLVLRPEALGKLCLAHRLWFFVMTGEISSRRSIFDCAAIDTAVSSPTIQP